MVRVVWHNPTTQILLKAKDAKSWGRVVNEAREKLVLSGKRTEEDATQPIDPAHNLRSEDKTRLSFAPR